MGYLQSKSTSTGSAGSTTVAITLTSNIVSGNKIVGYWFWNSASDDFVSLADNLGNTYTIVDTVNNGDIQKSFWANVTVGGACTITGTTTGSNGFRGMVAHEVSGLISGAPEQHQTGNQAAPGTGADGITTASVTTIDPGQYIFGAAHVNATVVMTVTQGTNYTDRESIDGTALISALESEDRVQSGAGSIAATFTENSNQPATSCIMTFKQAISGLGVTIGTGPGISAGLPAPGNSNQFMTNWWPYSPPAPVAVSVVFRKTLSGIGSRTGSRQVQG